MSAWWTLHPESGEPVRVLPADTVDRERTARHQAEALTDVMREGAARLLVQFRKTRVLPDELTNQSEIDAARREVTHGLDWLARGAPPVEQEDCDD